MAKITEKACRKIQQIAALPEGNLHYSWRLNKSSDFRSVNGIWLVFNPEFTRWGPFWKNLSEDHFSNRFTNFRVENQKCGLITRWRRVSQIQSRVEKWGHLEFWKMPPPLFPPPAGPPRAAAFVFSATAALVTHKGRNRTLMSKYTSKFLRHIWYQKSM